MFWWSHSWWYFDSPTTHIYSRNDFFFPVFSITNGGSGSKPEKPPKTKQESTLYIYMYVCMSRWVYVFLGHVSVINETARDCSFVHPRCGGPFYFILFFMDLISPLICWFVPEQRFSRWLLSIFFCIFLEVYLHVHASPLFLHMLQYGSSGGSVVSCNI